MLGENCFRGQKQQVCDLAIAGVLDSFNHRLPEAHTNDIIGYDLHPKVRLSRFNRNMLMHNERLQVVMLCLYKAFTVCGV